jgi:hypothetical protein
MASAIPGLSQEFMNQFNASRQAQQKYTGSKQAYKGFDTSVLGQVGQRFDAERKKIAGADTGTSFDANAIAPARVGDYIVAKTADGRYQVFNTKDPSFGTANTVGDMYDGSGKFLGTQTFDTKKGALAKAFSAAVPLIAGAAITAGVAGGLGVGPLAGGGASPAGFVGDPTAWGYGVTEGMAGAGTTAMGAGAAAGGAGATAAGGLMDIIKAATGMGGGTTGWASLIAPAMSAVGGYMNYKAAGDASDAMIGAANDGIAENRRQFDTVMKLLNPYIQAGTRGLDAYESLAGTKGAKAQQSAIKALQEMPEYASLVSEGENAILANASATGGLRGGDVQAGLAKFRPQVLSSLIERQLGRYGQLASTGQSSAVGAGNAALGTGQANAGLMQQAGAAQAGGIVAGSNAITNAVGGIGGFFAGYGQPQQPGTQPVRAF